MKLNIKLLSGLVATAALAVSAHAQLAANDISVGFTTVGSTNSFEVKAGSVSQLAGYTAETLIGNFGSQLNGIASAWATDLDTAPLYWGAQGQFNNTKVFAGSAWDATTPGTLGVQNSLDWAPASVGSANTGINTLNSTFGAGLTGTGHTVPNTTTGSFGKSLALTGNGLAFGTFDDTQFLAVGANLASGANYSALDLYQVVAGSSQILGTFALYQNGNLTFTAAIPEPSTYAAILGVATLGFAALRRRKQALLA